MTEQELCNTSSEVYFSFERKHNDDNILYLFTYKNYFPDFDPVSSIWNNPFMTNGLYNLA